MLFALKASFQILHCPFQVNRHVETFLVGVLQPLAMRERVFRDGRSVFQDADALAVLDVLADLGFDVGDHGKIRGASHPKVKPQPSQLSTPPPAAQRAISTAGPSCAPRQSACRDPSTRSPDSTRGPIARRSEPPRA